MTKGQTAQWTIKTNEVCNIANRATTSTVTRPTESTIKHSCFL